MFSELTQRARNNNVVRMMPSATSTLSSAFQWQSFDELDPGEVLFQEGERARDLFEVTEGVLRAFNDIIDGRRVITSFYFPGDVIGISFRHNYLVTAEAVTPVRVRRCSRAQAQRKMIENMELRPIIYATLCDEMAVAQSHMVLLARKSAEERLCSFLLMLARRRIGSPQSVVTVEVPMGRQDIADYLGLTIETVSRNFTRLTAHGVINPIGRHRFGLKMDKLVLRAGDYDMDLDNKIADVG